VSSPKALLIDFGGVLTSNVFDAFGDFCTSVGLDADAFAVAVRSHPEASQMLVAVETGQLSEDEFERQFAPILCEGTDVVLEPEGLIARLTTTLRPDPAMIDVVRRVKQAGHPTSIVSNTFGYGAYEGYDIETLVDDVVLSGDVGVRKPSRRIYTLAAERLGVDPADCVFVDDLAHNVSGAERVGMTGLHHTVSAETVSRLEELFSLAVAVR
jgi:putative hydrolase of the HAD superfamily